MGTSTYLPKLYGVKARSSALQAITSGEILTWQSTEYDVGDMWTTGSNINIKQSGVYHVIVQLDYAASSAGTYRETILSSANLGSLSAEVVGAGPSDFRMIFQNHWVGTLTKGDVLTAYGYHNAGGTLANTDTSSFFIVQQIRGL